MNAEQKAWKEFQTKKKSLLSMTKSHSFEFSMSTHQIVASSTQFVENLIFWAKPNVTAIWILDDEQPCTFPVISWSTKWDEKIKKEQYCTSH